MLWKSYSSPLYYLFVVPCGTYQNYDGDIDIFFRILLYVNLIGIDWVFFLKYYVLFLWLLFKFMS